MKISALVGCRLACQNRRKEGFVRRGKEQWPYSTIMVRKTVSKEGGDSGKKKGESKRRVRRHIKRTKGIGIMNGRQRGGGKRRVRKTSRDTTQHRSANVFKRTS